MSRSCVCGGSNENCRYCGGTGMLPDRLGAALDETLHRVADAQLNTGSGKVRQKLVSHRLKGKPVTPRAPDQRRIKRISVRPPANLVPCPQGCGAMVSARKLARHLRKIHHLAPDASPNVHNLATTAPVQNSSVVRYEACGICNSKVRADRIQRHMLKVHKTANPVVPNSTVKVADPSLAVATCPKCKAKLRADRLESHIRWAHRGRKKRKRRKKGKANDPRPPRIVSGGLPGLGKRR
jgi:hypothetical protein